MQQEDLMKKHKIFSNFLESVVSDRAGDKEGFADITDL